MKLFYVPDHTSCANYVPDTESGFKFMSLSEGESIEGRDVKHNTIVFILNGEIELSCNEFLNKKFVTGDILFLVQASDITGRTLSPVEMVLCIFSSPTISLCEKYTLNSYVKDCIKTVYNFKPLVCRGVIREFLKLIKEYLRVGISCTHLHEIKQKELFILLRAIYTKEELAEFFHPIIGADIDFRAKILEKFHLEYTISQIAHELAMSSSLFTRKFNREFGLTYYQWVLKQKAKHIKHKLMAHTTTIGDIINEFHFSSPSHFTKYCKAQFNCTPVELIKKLRNYGSKN